MSKAGRHLFTSESVTEGHPDKVADQISDAVLDAILEIDPGGRVACETLLTTGLCIVAGEITTRGYVDIQRIARRTIESIGYTDASYGLDAASCSVLSAIDEQSGDIAMGVDTGGAGDQGMMFGYACRDTEELMPLPIMLAHGLTRRLATCRKDGSVPFFRPDGKSQVTVEYDNGTPIRVDAIVVSTQHAPDVSNADLESAVRDAVIGPTIPARFLDKNTKVWVNPTGRFVTGGPQGDTGLTGRKIIVDTYGGMGHHGGGAFSGKDPTKVDRSACYMARHIAKNLVAAGLRPTRRGAAGVRDRRRRSGLGPRQHVRDGNGSRGAVGRAGSRSLPAHPGRDHQVPRPSQAGVSRHRGVRTLRPQRAGVHLGGNGARPEAPGRGGELGRRFR